MKVSPGDWGVKKVRFSYQWLRNGKPIKGATKASYKLQRADAGKKISVRVTGSKPGYKNKSVTSTVRNDWKKVTKKATIRANQVFPAGSCTDVGNSFLPCSDGSFIAGSGGVRIYSSGFGDSMAVAGAIKLEGAPQRWRLTFNNTWQSSDTFFGVFATGSDPNNRETWRDVGGFSQVGSSFRTNWSKRIDDRTANFVIASLDWGSFYFQSITIEYETIL